MSCLGGVGGFTRHTQTQYIGGSYTGVYITNLPQQVSVNDPNDNPVAQTRYAGAALTDDPGISGHDGNFGTGKTLRGNVTNLETWLNAPPCCSWIDHPRTYDIAGNILTQQDGNGK